MSDSIKHECAVALLRLRRGTAHYADKFKAVDFGGIKLSLLLEKQHNRGQDGAGLVMPVGMKAQVEVVFQTVDALHRCCPDSSGDWYFTGNYPTKGVALMFK